MMFQPIKLSQQAINEILASMAGDKQQANPNPSHCNPLVPEVPNQPATAQPSPDADALIRRALEAAAVENAAGQCRCTTCFYKNFANRLETIIRNLTRKESP